MMRWIIGTSLRLRYLVVGGACFMVAFGIATIGNAPVDVFPEFAPPFVEVQTEGLGMSTEEVESLITIQLEESFSSTPNLEVMRSKSVPGLSAITLIFKQGTDPIRARQQVSERLAIAIPRLPSSSGIPWILQPLSATSRVMKIGITADNQDLVDLSMISYWTVRWRLMAVPGVANVVIWGDRWKQLQVQVDPERMLAAGVSLDEVQEVTSDALEFGLLKYTNAAKTRTGGFIDTPNQRLVVQHVLPAVGPDVLSKVTVYDKKAADGTPLTVGDVADVTWGSQPLFGDGVINDGSGLLLIVEKFPWGNTLDVTRGVEQALKDMEPGLPGIHFDSTIFRPADFIELSLANLRTALLIGGLLVVLVLIAFLFEWRTAVISLVAIPLSLLAAVLVLHAQGATINTMILAGLVIALGEVVDDAIIDVENITRRLRQARAEGSGRSTALIVLDASLEVRSAIVYATLIMVLAVSPIFFVQGVTGSFFQPLALTYAVAVIVSLVVALTVTPALSLILLARLPAGRRGSPLVAWLQRGYQAVLSRIIRSPRPALATVGGLLVTGVVIFPFLGESLFPEFHERDFLMHWVSIPGTSKDESQRITTAASVELRQIPGVRNFGSHIGRATWGEEIVGVNFAENWISIDPAANYDETLANIEEVVAGYPGLFRNVETYLNERIEEVLVGSSDQIVIRIFGPDLQTLRDKAEEIRSSLETIPGIQDLHTALQVDIPHIAVHVNLDEAQRYGLKPGDVRRAAATLVAGTEVSDIHKDGKVFDIIVWSTPETRDSVTAIQRMLIDTPDGGHVRLGDVADVAVAPTPNAIDREGSSRLIDVSLNTAGRDLGAVVADVQDRLAGISFPLEYHAQLLGEYVERQSAQSRLLGFALLALAGIFLLLQAAFASWRLAGVLLVTLPMALVGGILASLLTGGILSIGSLVGFVTVLGIAARNGIMLINHYQHLELAEGEPFGPSLVLRGARERLSPILMTSLAAGLALMPLVVAGDVPGHEIEHPMAIVILGGLLTSTLLNLFVTPTLYLHVARRDHLLPRRSPKARLAAG